MPAMPSPAQSEASRLNGACSAGPATEAGKARSSLNAVRHGLSGRTFFLLPDEDAAEFGFSGVFREVEPGKRLVHSESYDPGTTGQGMGDGEALVTVTFAEDGGVTTVISLIDFGTKESRDAAVATGMTDGMEQSYQLLDRVLTEQPASQDVSPG